MPPHPDTFRDIVPDFRVVNPLDHPDWDEQLLAFAGAGFFHTRAWTQVLRASYGYLPLWLVHETSGRRAGLFPLMEVASWLTGRRGIGLPFTDVVAPLGADENLHLRLHTAALQLARARHWKYLECRAGRPGLPGAAASTSFLRHVLPLGVGETALLAGCEDAVRRAIRKAERSHLQVEFSRSAQAMQDFYRLMCLTRRRHGVPPQPYAFFVRLQEQAMAREHGWIVLARTQGRAVAGAIFLHFNRRAIYKFGASDETQQHLRGNNLVMWRAIQHYAAGGFLDLDFGRTSVVNAGLRQFKLGWGTREEAVGYTRYDLRRSAFVAAADEAQGWHNRVFRALPAPLSRLAGRLLYRHIA